MALVGRGAAAIAAVLLAGTGASCESTWDYTVTNRCGASIRTMSATDYRHAGPKLRRALRRDGGTETKARTDSTVREMGSPSVRDLIVLTGPSRGRTATLRDTGQGWRVVFDGDACKPLGSE